MGLSTFFAGKTVLLSGTTGFLGKVVLEKILWDLSSVERVYLLVRSKKGVSPADRFRSEIANSQIFDRLRKKIPDFELFLHDKIVPIAGDLDQPNLGVESELYRQLLDEVQVVINSAAIVDFNDRLDRAVSSNALGASRVLHFAKAGRRIEVMVHVSTCYVSSREVGTVLETLPPLDFDPREAVDMIMQMDVDELVKLTPKIIGTFPNTYTFAKAVSENLLAKERGNVPLAIVRPSIIGASWKEPMPGWVDTVSAAGALYLASGFGVLTYVPGDIRLIGDQIPVDIVCNMILAAASYTASQPVLNIFHCGSSVKNPVPWGVARDHAIAYWRAQPPKGAVRRAMCHITTDTLDLKWRFLADFAIPSYLAQAAATVWPTQDLQKKARRLERTVARMLNLQASFRFFVENEWFFDTTQADKLYSVLSPEELTSFRLDVVGLDWQEYTSTFNYGLAKFVLKEDVQPLPPATNLMNSSVDASSLAGVFSDITFAASRQSSIPPTIRSREDAKMAVLGRPLVQAEIRSLATKEGITLEAAEARARTIVTRMAADFRTPAIRFFGWALQKILRKMYAGVLVQPAHVERIKKAMQKGPVVLTPTHRSYFDFLMVSYLCFSYDLPCPHIAAGEDFLNLAIVTTLFRCSGAFFMRRAFGGDSLYTSIFAEYSQLILKDSNPLEFFLEGTRSRSGKILHPKVGLLSIVLEPFFSGEVPNLSIIPISINYDKVVEANSHARELLGQKKIKESFPALIKSAPSTLQVQFGRIEITIGEAIDVKEFMTASSSQISPDGSADPWNNPACRKLAIRQLSQKITFDLISLSLCMPISIVAATLLMYRLGITRAQLVSRYRWLTQQIQARGRGVSHPQGPVDSVVETTLKLLGPAVTEQPADKFYVPAATPLDGAHTMLLTYYRNFLLQVFVGEALVACAMHAAGDLHSGVEYEKTLHYVEFLGPIFWGECIHERASEDPRKNFDHTLEQMKHNGIITVEGALIRLAASGEQMYLFLCHLFWPLLDSYWAAAIALHTLHPPCVPGGDPPTALADADVHSHVHSVAHALHRRHRLPFFESCATEHLKNAVAYFTNQGVLARTGSQLALSEGYREEASLWSLARDHAATRANKSDAGYTSRMSLLIDLPLMSRL